MDSKPVQAVSVVRVVTSQAGSDEAFGMKTLNLSRPTPQRMMSKHLVGRMSVIGSRLSAMGGGAATSVAAGDRIASRRMQTTPSARPRRRGCCVPA